MEDILVRLANSSSNEGSHDLQCRCFDAAEEISKLRDLIQDIKEWDVNQYMTIPHELRIRIESVLKHNVKLRGSEAVPFE